jgi:hypothetical protein
MKVPAPHSEKQSKTMTSFKIQLTNQVQLSGRILAQTSEVSKAVNAGVVSVSPSRLQRITTHQIKAEQLKTSFSVAHTRARHVTEHIGFAAAPGARAGAPKSFKIQIRFCTVVPGNRQLVPDLLNVRWFKAHRYTG